MTRFAAEAGDPRVAKITDRVAAPLRIAVRGRPGVGRGTVARALAGAGLTVTPDGADIVVQVIAEVVKPEDAAAVAGLPQPVLVVLNKADLSAPTRTHCARLSALTGAPVEPMTALLAVADLDGAVWAALRVLAAEPHRVSRADRQRLLAGLDRWGITGAVAAIRRGSTRGEVGALLRRASRVDAVVARITAVGAEVAYRRMADAVAELEVLAVGAGAVGDFLTRDDTVIARMATAQAVLAAAGLATGAGNLRRAVAGQRYSRGPVSDLHRGCGADIARGALRLWSRAGDAR